MSTIPQCLGIIMDGNRRWAKEKGLPSLAGHKAGYDKLKDVIRWSKELGVKYVIAYAFSTENWKRTEEEVGYLMDMFRFAIRNELAELGKEKINVRFIGDIDRLPEDIKTGIADIENKTKDAEITLVLAISYGARSEIISAVKKAIQAGKADQITESTFGQFLNTADIPDPDLIIRTSGEQRLSNFLLWQSAYSELFFTKTYWPALTKEEFTTLIEAFAARERRIGK